MNELGMALVWCALQVTLLSLAAILVCYLMRGSSPALRSWTVLLTLLAIPCLTILAICPLPSWFDGRGGKREATTSVMAPASIATAADSDQAHASAANVAQGAGETPSGMSLSSFGAAFVDELTSQPLPLATGNRTRWPVWFAGITLACGLLGLAHLTISWLATFAYRQRGTPVHDQALLELLDVTCAKLHCQEKIQLLEVDGLAGPATLGYLRPVILLPTDWRTWTLDERRAVLAHEVAHVVHGDYITGLVAQSCLALHFYHPLIHWLVARLRLDQELAADASAATVVGGQRNYLTTLAEMALQEDKRTVLFPGAHLPTNPTEFPQENRDVANLESVTVQSVNKSTKHRRGRACRYRSCDCRNS